MPINGKVIVHDELVRQKLLMSAPRILANNREMVEGMLDWVKAEIEPTTPLGPGHFGYHLKDTYKVRILGGQGPTKTAGRLTAAVQGYWREFGTRGRNRSHLKAGRAELGAAGIFGRQATALITAGGGEKAGLYATHALAGARAVIRNFYGKAQWWRL